MSGQIASCSIEYYMPAAAALACLFFASCSSNEKELGEPDETGVMGDDTGWREELTTYDCTMTVQGGFALEATSYSAEQAFIPGEDQPVGYYFQASAVTYEVADTGEYCGFDEAYPSVIDGSAEGSYLFDVRISLPIRDDPVAYQGSYPFEDTPFWGADPALIMLIGWYEEPDGYDIVVDGLAEDAGICLSRVRPDRVSGVLWWVAPDDRPDLGGPFYIAFDVGERGPNAAPACFSTSYEFGLEETDVWPQLEDGK